MLYQLSHVRALPPPEPGGGATRNHSRADGWSPNIPARVAPVNDPPKINSGSRLP